MKKIIALFILSALLVSCTNNEINDTIVEEPNKENTIIESKEINEIEDILEEEINNINNNDKKIIEKNIPMEEINKMTTNEEFLEEEVNDLLDEIIDSLDNYDK